jgi:hypothetical protein
MITLQLPDAQRELPALADKALRGEQVFIVVAQKISGRAFGKMLFMWR